VKAFGGERQLRELQLKNLCKANSWQRREWKGKGRVGMKRNHFRGGKRRKKDMDKTTKSDNMIGTARGEIGIKFSQVGVPEEPGREKRKAKRGGTN